MPVSRLLSHLNESASKKQFTHQSILRGKIIVFSFTLFSESQENLWLISK